jgi:hypothetical protein
VKRERTRGKREVKKERKEDVLVCDHLSLHTCFTNTTSTIFATVDNLCPMYICMTLLLPKREVKRRKHTGAA